MSPWIKELIVAGLDDWILATDVLGVVSRSNIRDTESLRALWIGVVAEALATGLLEPGDVSDGAFRPWSASVGDAISKIVSELDRIGVESIGLGDVVWLRNTQSGDAAAEEAVASGWDPAQE